MIAISHCSRGHLLTPDNIRMEKGGRIRCKACVSNRMRMRYRNDTVFRRSSLAYAHWFRYGDPEGKTWPEIKAEISCQPSH